MIIIPTILKKKLLIYIEKKKIKKGIIFCTRTGKEKDRSNIWREMKKIAELSGVSLEKVFPHNLRHLFARIFYRETKNLIHLADILGHNSLEVTKIYTTDSIEAVSYTHLLYLMNAKAPCFIKDEEESYIYLILPVNFNAAV